MLLSNQNSNSYQKELTSNEAEQSPQQKLLVILIDAISGIKLM